MLEVLYDEAAPEVTRRVEDHLEVCASCREDLAAFRRIRRGLRGFTLPSFAAPQRRRSVLWVRGLAAAALVLVALGASSAQARLSALEQRLEAQGQSHAREVAELRQALVAMPAPAGRFSDGEVIRRVTEMLRESEERQGQRLAASLRELSQRSAEQRRYDLARVSAGLSYLDGRSGQHAARTAELMGHLLQAAEQK